MFCPQSVTCPPPCSGSPALTAPRLHGVGAHGPAGRAPRGGTQAGNPTSPLLPSARCHPRDTIFVKKKPNKFCTAVQQQLVRKVAVGGSRGMRSQQTARARPLQAASSQDPPLPRPPRPPFAPSQPSQPFGIVSPPNTHRCRNLESFHTTQVLFPDRGCEFLLSLGRGCMCLPPAQSAPNQREQAGKKLGKGWEKSSEITARLERVWRQSSH